MNDMKEVEDEDDEAEETKIEPRKNIKKMLAEAIRVYLISTNNFLQGSFSPKIYSLI